MASGGPYGIDAGAHKVGLPSERAQIIQLGRARLECGRRPLAIQNGGYLCAYDLIAVTEGDRLNGMWGDTRSGQ